MLPRGLYREMLTDIVQACVAGRGELTKLSSTGLLWEATVKGFMASSGDVPRKCRGYDLREGLLITETARRTSLPQHDQAVVG